MSNLLGLAHLKQPVANIMIKRRRISAILFSFTLLLASYGMLAHATGWPESVAGKPMPSLAPMLKKVMPAVVNVSAQGQIKIKHNPFPDYDPIYKKHPRQAEGKFFSLGSGVIINHKKGYIVTNAHVVYGANDINVTLNDGRHFKAKLIGMDVPSDIAVLQIHAKHLTAIHIANSSRLEVGDFVLAIGNPFGLNQTVTSGIVSALQRTDLHIEGYENFIQTDAPINAGNSGGALINIKGQLVGINTAILTQDGGSIGIGFAIPSNMGMAVMQQLIKYGKVNRGIMGVMVQTFTPALANVLHLPVMKGAVITQITPDSPAQKAGLKPYDVIEKINGQSITSASQVKTVVGILRIDQILNIEVRRGNATKLVQMKIGNPGRIAAEQLHHNPYLLHVKLRNYDEQSSSQGHVMGIQVVQVGQDSAASHAQLIAGDVITAVNQKPVHNLQQLDKLTAKKHGALLLHVLRNGGAFLLVLK